MRKMASPSCFTWFAVMAVLLLGLLAVPAHAQSVPLNLALQSPENAIPGQTVTFTGTITDPATDGVFVNNIRFAFTGNAGSFLLVNQASYNLFYSSVPGLFFSGDTVTTPVFSVQVAGNTPAGDYSGTATLLGGADQNAQNVISNAAPFLVRVGSGAAVPEPGTLPLTAMAALPFAGIVVRRRLMRETA